MAVLLALGCVAALGIVRAWDPFNGDQALFTLGAEKLHAGGVLYRDFWDLKQPGIFLFYLAGGSLAGFTQTGLHRFEIVWECAFGLALFAALGPALRAPRVAAFAILAVPGAFYAGTGPYELGQVEALTGLPLFCCVWAALGALRAREPRGEAGWAFASGVAAGCVAGLKLLYLPCALAVVVAAASGASPARRSAATLGAWWTLGLALPLALFGVYAVRFGIVGEALHTFLTLPAHIVASGRAPLSRLEFSTLWFLRRFGGLVLLAVAGGFFARDGLGRAWRRAAYAWLAAGYLAIVLQTQSWWEYQFVLLLPPLGILATFGFDSLIALVREPDPRIRVPAALVLVAAAELTFPLAHGAESAAVRVLRERPFASDQALQAYRTLASAEYASAARDAAFLGTGAGGAAFSGAGTGGPAVYVCGDPLIYLLANRAQAVPINGWALELYPADWWAHLVAELQAARPADVFVSSDYSELIRARSPALVGMLAKSYKPAARFADGTWYRLTESAVTTRR